MKISPGEEWTGLINQDEVLEKIAGKGRLYAAIHHSMSRKPARARIRFKQDGAAKEEAGEKSGPEKRK